MKQTENKKASAIAADDTSRKEDFMTKKTAAKKTSAKNSGPVVYVGPNLPGGIMSAYTVYRNGLPAHVTQLQDKTPEIARLIVSIKELARVRKQLLRHGDKANAYKAVAKKYNL